MRKKTLILCICVIAVTVLVLAGCGGDAATKGGGPKGEVTITTNFTEGELPGDTIANFEKDNPNIKVEAVEATDEKLMAMIAAGNAPDVIRIYGARDIPTFVSRNLALNLDDYFDNSPIFKNKDDFLPVVDVYRFDGQKQGSGPYYGFVKDYSLDNTLWVNKRVFENANVPIPDDSKPLTYSELFELAEKLTVKQGDETIIFGYGQTFGSGLDYDTLMLAMLQKGESVWSDDFNSAKFNTPAVKDFMKQWYDFVKTGACISPINVSTVGPLDLFMEDKVAILTSGYWYSGMIRSNENVADRMEDFIHLPSPVIDGGERISTTTAACGGIIYKNTEHPDEAFKFFEYFLGGEPANERARSGWGIPAFKSKLELLPQETEFDKQCFKVLMEELKYSDNMLPYNPYTNYTSIQSAVDKILSPVYFDKETIDEAAEKLNNEAELLIQEGKDIMGL